MTTAVLRRDPVGVQGALGWEEFENPTSQPHIPFEFGTEACSSTLDFWVTDSIARCFFLQHDVGGEEFEVDSSTVSSTGDYDNMKEPFEKTKLDLALSIVREFERLEHGWDEPDTPAPGEDLVDDALVVLQNWPISKLIPEPCVDSEGHIALELYDEDGFVMGGVEVTGEHNAIFSIVRQTEILCTGSFDTRAPASMIKALSNFRQFLG